MADCNAGADPSNTPRQVALDELRLEDACQARMELDPEVVDDYAELYKAGAELPAIQVFEVGGELIVIDGWHRCHAAIKANLAFLPVVIVGTGELDDAIWCATSANKAHGLRRSNVSKRKATRMAIESGVGSEQSSRVIAEHVGVSHAFVSKVRREVETVSTSPVVGSDGKRYPVKSKDPRSDADTPISLRDDYASDEWHTPPEVVDPVRKVLGKIDLDPASNEVAQETVRATEYFDKKADGLRRPWHGRVWLNPPFSTGLGPEFVSKLCDEYEAGRVTEAILLQNASTSTAWFHRVGDCCSAMCFVRRRISFLRADGSRHTQNQYAQVLAYFGPRPARFCQTFDRLGLIVRPADDLIVIDCPFCDGGGCPDCSRGRTTKGDAHRARERAARETEAAPSTSIVTQSARGCRAEGASGVQGPDGASREAGAASREGAPDGRDGAVPHRPGVHN